MPVKKLISDNDRYQLEKYKALAYLLMSASQRIAAGWPDVTSRFQELEGVDARNYYNWVTKWEALGVIGVSSDAHGAAAEVAGTDSGGVRDGMASMVEVALVELNSHVANGDKQALNTLFSMPVVKQFLEAQLAAYERTFASVEDDELEVEIASFVSDEVLLAECERRGWRVSA